VIDKILRKRRYVREFDEDYDIPYSLVNSLLKKTWKVTPSKNNFMPYMIHVLGPAQQKYKEKVFENCLSSEGLGDGIEDPLNTRYKDNLPNYGNILSCSYLLIFTLRLEDKPNPFQKAAIDDGHRYEAVDENRLDLLYPSASLEVGMFANSFSSLCLKKDIDVSFVGCFHRDLSKWSDIPFVTRTPILLMPIGKGKVYRDKTAKQSPIERLDLKPNYERIVNFIQ